MNHVPPSDRPTSLAAVDPVEVVRSVVLGVSVDDAWELVGTEDGLARWLGADVCLVPEPGGAMAVRDDDGTERRGRVLDVQPGRTLTFEWEPGDGDDERSSVTFTVDEADGGAARVTVVESRAGGRVAACLDAGAAWDQRLLGLELDVLAGVSPLALAAPLA